jgi:MSHA biogenesis protein MshE
MALSQKIRLGDLLVQQKIISEDQLQSALEQQQRQSTRRRLGRVLVENAFVTEEDICRTISTQLGIPYIDLQHYKINDELVRLLKEEQARRYQAIVLEKRQSGFLVGMADPIDTSSIDKLGSILFGKIEIAVVAERWVLECIDRTYLRSQRILGLD